MRIDYHRHFRKQYRKFPQKIQKKFNQKLLLFESNPFLPMLNNHTLAGKYAGQRSIDITGDIRAIYEINGNIIIFLQIGTHHDLYGK